MPEIMPLCARCKGKGLCGKPCPILMALDKYKAQINSIKESFSGSAPSVFVGRHGYPDVNVGILSPPEIETSAWQLDAPEFWYSENYSLDNVIGVRSRLIHSKDKGNVKKLNGKVIEAAQLIAMAKKPVNTAFFLKNKPKPQFAIDSYSAPVGSPAKIKSIKLEENPKIRKKVDYIVNDDLKAAAQISMLFEKSVSVNQISKIMSVGLLGTDANKKLVPTRYSITATDDTISKKLIEEIKTFEWIDKITLFSNDYMGNHYEILLIPRQWSYELIEAKTPGSVWNPWGKEIFYMIDYEQYFGRKTYAENCCGGYYAVRFSIAQYLYKIKRQATAFVVREVRPEYAFPAGVWVCRETSRNAFNNRPENFDDIEKAIDNMFGRMSLPKQDVLRRSELMKDIRVQRTLKMFK